MPPAVTLPYHSGIAFVLEGVTEKVFYQEYLEWCCRGTDGAAMERLPDKDYVVHVGNKATLVKFNVMGSVSSIPNATAWVQKTCKESSLTSWTVVLCYDTDGNSSLSLNTRAWQRFRQDLKAMHLPVIDLAADADIEDVMLADLDGVRRYLGLPSDVLPRGKKGKSKLNSLFKVADITRPYHEAERARDLIRHLDFAAIEERAPMDLARLHCALMSEG